MQVQDIAAMFNPPLELVSPAPSSDCFDADGVCPWLDQFLGNCSQVVEGCDVDLITKIAFHDYVIDSAEWSDPDEMVAALEQRIEGIYTR